MADATNVKKGLTPFGWLLVGGAAAFLLGSKERRQKTATTLRGWLGKDKPADAPPAG